MLISPNPSLLHSLKRTKKLSFQPNIHAKLKHGRFTQDVKQVMHISPVLKFCLFSVQILHFLQRSKISDLISVPPAYFHANIWACAKFLKYLPVDNFGFSLEIIIRLQKGRFGVKQICNLLGKTFQYLKRFSSSSISESASI